MKKWIFLPAFLSRPNQIGTTESSFRLFLIVAAVLIASLAEGQNWSATFDGVGTFSSPRCADLNGDGVLDIVMGAGREEFIKCDSAIMAIDGETGRILWHVAAIDQMFGSAQFMDVNGDQIDDVFIGGRSSELFSIDGASGNVIWNFRLVNKIEHSQNGNWFNFYNPQFIGDRDGDGLGDLIVSNGGDVLAEPHDSNRPPGQLVIISSATGKILSQANMPDGKEIYMSIGVDPQWKDPKIVFGTGGETVGGNLWVTNLSAVVKGDLTSAVKLDESKTKGYIGPPAIVDITGDGVKDIISNSVDGRMMAFSGTSYEKLWEVTVPNTESYSSITVGQFGKDTTPDFFLTFGRGVWPSLGWGIQKMVSGKTGYPLFTDSLGFYQNTASLAYDVNGDSRDDIIMSLNFHEVNELYQKYFYTTLMSIDFATGSVERIGEIHEGSNLSSTPWAGDLDGDGFLDIIHCHGTNLRHTYTFDQIKLHRIATDIPIREKIKWGAYQGSSYDGIYR